jgi:hypothetical protein
MLRESSNVAQRPLRVQFSVISNQYPVSLQSFEEVHKLINFRLVEMA